MTAKCFCNQCSTHLEFDPANAGEVITCPSCEMETKLYIPPSATLVPAETPAPLTVPVNQNPAVAPAKAQGAVDWGMVRLILCCVCMAIAIGITGYSFTLRSGKTAEELQGEESAKQIQKSTRDALKASQDLDAAMRPR